MLTILPLLCVLLSARALPVVSAVDPNEIQQILKHVVENRQTVGIVVGIVDADGSKIFSYGKTGRDGRNVDGDSVFEIGSATKTFTATLLADMVKRGLLSLDDSVSKYLPDTVKVPSRGEKGITLLDLATHRSGLPRLPNNVKPADADNPYAGYTAEKMYEFLSNYQIPKDIREKYEYSNFGAGLLGHILERRAGKSYEALLTMRIFRPLKMKSTAISLSPDMYSRLAVGHSESLTPVKNMDFGALAGGGAIRSTVNDMLKYVAAYMGLRPSPLSAAMEMAQQDYNDTNIPNTRIGLAWHLLKRPDSVIVWHNGGTGGYHSFVSFDRKKGLGVVVLSNSTNDIDNIGFHLMDPQIPFEAKKDRKEITVDPGLLDAYVGDYQVASNFVLAITKEGNLLFVQATGQPRMRLHPEAETEFFVSEANAQVSFVKDTTGKVSHLILHLGGQDMKAERIK